MLMPVLHQTRCRPRRHRPRVAACAVGGCRGNGGNDHDGERGQSAHYCTGRCGVTAAVLLPLTSGGSRRHNRRNGAARGDAVAAPTGRSTEVLGKLCLGQGHAGGRRLLPQCSRCLPGVPVRRPHAFAAVPIWRARLMDKNRVVEPVALRAAGIVIGAVERRRLASRGLVVDDGHVGTLRRCRPAPGRCDGAGASP
jgi:hypothetical protein